MKEQKCVAELVHITPLTDSILQLQLRPETYIAYESGQYLKININDESLCYSIANAPLGAHVYELHIRHSGGDPYKQPFFAHLKEHGCCDIQLPFGQCFLGQLDTKKPVIFIAAGTGFAPIKAMMEEMLAREDGRPMHLFWGARDASDIYLEQQVLQWQSHVTRFQAEFLIENKNENRLAKAVLKLPQTLLSQAQFVISGPFPLVYRIRNNLMDKGVSIDHMHSDAFAFEK